MHFCIFKDSELKSMTFLQHLPGCRFGSTGSSYSGSAFVGEPGHRWASGHSLEFQSRRPGHYDKVTAINKRLLNQSLAPRSILRDWRSLSK